MPPEAMVERLGLVPRRSYAKMSAGMLLFLFATLIFCQAALYFPDIEGTPLNGNNTLHTADLCDGNVSVIAMLSTVVSEVRMGAFLLGLSIV